MLVKFKSETMSLVGRRLKPLNKAPDFKAVTPDLKPVGLEDFKTKIKVITSFLSLDTPVCDLQVKEFNKQAGAMSDQVVILGISKDLPFAQKRFCAANDIKNIALLSDYQYSSFGINYGLLVKELNLLARSVIIVDKNDIVRYIEIVEELTHPPDYGRALKSLKDIINSPEYILKEALPSKCKPCEIGAVAALTKDKIEELFVQTKNWQLVEDKKITKEFRFKDFTEAKYFLDLVSVIAQEQGHHPVMTLAYNKLKITLITHAAGGLTENDFIMAGIIDSFE